MASQSLFTVVAQSLVAHLTSLRRPFATEKERLGNLSPSLHNSSDAYIRHARGLYLQTARQGIRKMRDVQQLGHDVLHHEIQNYQRTASRTSCGAFEDLWRGFNLTAPVRLDDLVAEDEDFARLVGKNLRADGWPTHKYDFWQRVDHSVKLVEDAYRAEILAVQQYDLGGCYPSPEVGEFSAAVLVALRSANIAIRKRVKASMAVKKEIVKEQAKLDERIANAKAAKRKHLKCLADLSGRISDDGLVPHPENPMRFVHPAAFSRSTHAQITGPVEVELIGPLADHVWQQYIRERSSASSQPAAQRKQPPETQHITAESAQLATRWEKNPQQFMIDWLVYDEGEDEDEIL